MHWRDDASTRLPGFPQLKSIPSYSFPFSLENLQYVNTLSREWINEMNGVRYSLNDAYLSDSPELMGQLGRETDHAIFADRNNLNTESEFTVERVVMHILRYNSLGDLITARNHRCQEVDHFSRLSLICVEKVDAFVDGFDAQSRFMSFVSQNKLL